MIGQRSKPEMAAADPGLVVSRVEALNRLRLFN